MFGLCICINPTRCGEHCPSVLAHLAKVLAMIGKPEDEVLKNADSGYASYSRRLPDTQGGGGELVVGYNMSNMLGT